MKQNKYLTIKVKIIDLVETKDDYKFIVDTDDILDIDITD